MRNPPLLFFFILALFAQVFGAFFFPSIRFIPFAPFLAIIFQRKNLLISLWIALFCGLVLDLLNSEIHFGGFALCYLVTAASTYRFKQYFFEEGLVSIPLNSALISIVFSAVQFFIVKQLISFNLKLILTSFLIMPFFDALYAFFWFTCPAKIYNLVFKKRIVS